MTISTTGNNRDSYTTNGSTTAFAVTFPFLQVTGSTHALKVIKVTTADGTEEVLTENSDYTVAQSGGDPSTGTVTISPALASGFKIYILPSITVDQQVNLENATTIDMPTIEKSFDKLTLINQSQDERLTRAVLLPETTDVTDVILPISVTNAGKVVSINDAGTGFDTTDIDELVSISSFDLSTLTASTAMVGTDHTVWYDVSLSSQVKGTITDLTEAGMLGFTTVAEVDTDNDLVPIKDATDGTMKLASAALFGGAGPDGSLKSVQAATKTDSETIASPSDWTDITGLTVTLSPASIESTILLSTSISFESANAQRVSFRISKGERNIDLLSDKPDFSIPAEGDVSVNYLNGAASQVFFSVVDVADTTESITYKVQVKSANAGNLIINGEQTTTDSDIISRSACQLTMIEVL